VFFQFSTIRGFFSRPPFAAPLCSAFYRARELAKTIPCYSPAFTGLLINPRAGPWAKDVVHDWIELLQFSLLNRLSPCEMIQNGVVGVLGNDYFSPWSLNF
jgi:hypothetical protein